MSALEVNIPLLRKAVEWAEAEAALEVERSQWYQGQVVAVATSLARTCGTCYCIAGYVASIETGYADPYDAPEVDDIGVLGFAADRLGIPHDNFRWSPLFHGGNTIEDVRRIAESLAGERL